MAQPKISKPQSSSDKKLHIAVIVCIVLVIVSFIGNILLIRYSFEISNNEFHRHVNLVQSRLREVNLRVQNDPKNEKEIERLNDINTNHR
ncbi:hypothetical protein HG471_000455 [Candidatus Saccharibacteria bacterium]|nr:hypothetical protein [Candidatus Saccharibacteria bacterium]